jgi:hypothetical protein
LGRARPAGAGCHPYYYYFKVERLYSFPPGFFGGAGLFAAAGPISVFVVGSSLFCFQNFPSIKSRWFWCFAVLVLMLILTLTF